MKASKAVISLFAIYEFSQSAGAAPAVNQESNSPPTLNTTASFVDAQPLSSVTVSYTNGSNLTLGEDLPEDFRSSVQYKLRGVPLYSIDVLVNLVTALSTLAVLPWTQVQESFTHDDASLRLRFASTRAPGRQKLTTKEVMWAIRIVSNFLHTEKQGYAEVNFQPFYEGSELLGSAQLLKLAAPSLSPPSGAAGNVDVAKRGGTDNVSPSTGNLIRVPDSVTPGASNAAAEIEDLMVYREGKTFDPYIIYTILMNLNTLLAEQENMEAATGGVYGFDIPQDWQVGLQSLSPTSLSLTPRIIVEATADLAVRLAMVQPEEFRWRESAFKIKANGRVVGTGFIHHRGR